MSSSLNIKKVYRTVEDQQGKRVFYINKNKDAEGEGDSSSSNEIDVNDYKGDIRVNDEIIKKIESTGRKKKLINGLEIVYKGEKPIKVKTEYEGNYQYNSYKIPIGTTALIKIPNNKGGYTYKMLKGGETYKLPKKEPNYFRKLWEGYKKGFKEHPVRATLSLVLNSAVTGFGIAASVGTFTAPIVMPILVAGLGYSAGLLGINNAVGSVIDFRNKSKQLDEKEKKLIEKEQKILKGRSHDRLSQEEKEKINRIKEEKDEIKKDRISNGFKTGFRFASSLLLTAVPAARLAGIGTSGIIAKDIGKSYDIFRKSDAIMKTFVGLQISRQVLNCAYITNIIVDGKRKGVKFGPGDIITFGAAYLSFAAFSVDHVNYINPSIGEAIVGAGIKQGTGATDTLAFSADYATSIPLGLAIDTAINSRKKRKIKDNLIKTIKGRFKRLEKACGKKFYERSVFNLKEKELQKYDIEKLNYILNVAIKMGRDVMNAEKEREYLLKKALIPEETLKQIRQERREVKLSHVEQLKKQKQEAEQQKPSSQQQVLSANS
ncbi:MAG: hypothetical protein LBC92_04500 [Rickettsiales bacterium]|jgi:hypothetical protein|nr:hypothetical protein [Rickettsiales bacterium]